MGYSLCVDEEEPKHLATNSGMKALRLWAESLSVKAYYNFRHLMEYAWTGDVGAAAEEVTTALRVSPPEDKHVIETAKGLEKILTEAKSAVLVSITNGMS